jgi:hypothetical protein
MSLLILLGFSADACTASAGKKFLLFWSRLTKPNRTKNSSLIAYQTLLFVEIGLRSRTRNAFESSTKPFVKIIR